MRSLMLLRHSKAASLDATIRDQERMLDARGRDDAPKMGAYMARHDLVPDEVMVSTATRTRETWALAAPAFPIPPLAVFDSRLYDAPAGTLLEIIKSAPDKARTLLLVGHNPGLHKLALLLIAAGDVEARERLSEELPTTGLVIIDFPVDDWNKLHPHAGRLDRFVTPRSLIMATD